MDKARRFKLANLMRLKGLNLQYAALRSEGHDPRRDTFGELRFMGYDEHGEATRHTSGGRPPVVWRVAGEFLYDLDYFFLHVGIKAGGWFIEENGARFHG